MFISAFRQFHRPRVLQRSTGETNTRHTSHRCKGLQHDFDRVLNNSVNNRRDIQEARRRVSGLLVFCD
jgi:hypothetical protein